MAKRKTLYFCDSCGHEEPKWFGKCPRCGAFNSAVEESVVTGGGSKSSGGKTARTFIDPASHFGPAQPIGSISSQADVRQRTGIHEFDRVLGGGLAPGSVTLLGGAPGIGKSTLMLHIAQAVAERVGTVLYVSGEESPQQIRLRAERVGTLHERLLVMTRTYLEDFAGMPEVREASLIIVDSVQSLVNLEINSAAGSMSQVREVAQRFTNIAKTLGVPVILIGHINKDGAIAGPKMVEHMVDTVLTFEGDDQHAYRLLRSEKNRFGAAQEIGVFEMRGSGLAEVSNPSALFVTERSSEAIGAVVTPVLEATRPLLVEVQALATKASFGNARRLATGIDVRRVQIVAAVLEKRLGLPLFESDLYVNVAGGLSLRDPASDVALAVAMLSSLQERRVPKRTVYLGEISLTGEVRPVAQGPRRLQEAATRGCEIAVVPESLVSEMGARSTLRLVPIEQVTELPGTLLPNA